MTTEQQFCQQFMEKPLDFLANELGDLLTSKKLRLTTAESCTGGLLGSTLCAAKDTPSFFGSGFITFTDEAKMTLLNVNPETLAKHTAVSKATVEEMVAGAVRVSGEDVGIAVSGYGGPDGGEDGTPAGSVWFGWALPGNKVESALQHFEGDCTEVLAQAVKYAIVALLFKLGYSSDGGAEQ
ncbi:2-oxo-tetronate isomerase [Pseudescherichia vulneris]|uniref:2-oxo-tetronate isomerase n=1 Tax=Pseudescherichia vulneris TaxID=566 RepID=UPI00227BE93A|nr:2-oxo-tetronate isomerase [Pseudescherichia vulneris]WAH53930.1 2-oxo-tetronate isomerase [Pseudescherichia vulneris]